MTLPAGAAEFIVSEDALQTSRTYRLDPDGGRIIGTIDGIEAVKQFVFKQLQTERFAHDIYSGRIGNEVRVTSVQTAVEEALLVDERVLSVEDFSPLQTGDELLLTFTVRSVFGTFEQGVNLNV